MNRNNPTPQSAFLSQQAAGSLYLGGTGHSAPLVIVAIFVALAFAAQVHAVSSSDVFYGPGAGNNTTTGLYDTAIGYYALHELSTGGANTASGYVALSSNTGGEENTATGTSALAGNTTGNGNVAYGAGALEFNVAGSNNTATGFLALLANNGSYNTASGYQALYNNQSANFNVANGVEALFANTTGAFNTAAGPYALNKNQSGSHNIGLGYAAGYNLTTGSNNIDIGNAGIAGESGTIRIGTKGTQKSAFIAGISGTTIPNGVGVIVGTGGKLGTIVSSARFKDQIKPMDQVSEAILALKPVSFHYKHELDPDGTPQFGLVAEEVEKVNPDLVVHDDEGKPYTVRYEAVNAMLLNEFLKEHRKVEQLETKMTQQEKNFQAAIAQQGQEIQALTATVKAQESQIQKVSYRVEIAEAAPQVVVKNQ